MSSHDQYDEAAELGPPRVFPRFRDLPAELRVKIWNLARPRRIITMTRSFTYNGPLSDPRIRGLIVHNPQPVPAIAHSCSEARYEVCVLGRRQLCGMHHIITPGQRIPAHHLLLAEPPTSEAFGAQNETHRYSWFDGSRDILFWTVRMPDTYEWTEEARRRRYTDY
ncbi:hypothetical protein F4810DRAFT_647355 [Camillea tinctor]|nr:hypothetical protein F4810DRAFT_647355 [Camillea tinctor]